MGIFALCDIAKSEGLTNPIRFVFLISIVNYFRRHYILY